MWVGQNHGVSICGRTGVSNLSSGYQNMLLIFPSLHLTNNTNKVFPTTMLSMIENSMKLKN